MDFISKQSAPASLDNLNELITSICTSARESGMEDKRVSQVELALEEALVNIINYAYPDEKGDIDVTCRKDHNGRFVIEISDNGVAFNVLAIDDPDTTSGISERQVGGLGIFLIKKLMHAVDYKRENDRNILRLTV